MKIMEIPKSAAAILIRPRLLRTYAAAPKAV